jgi:hypothetical protein
MLFLYRYRARPTQLPGDGTDQAAYNRELQRRFTSTLRVAPAVPDRIEPDPIADVHELEALRASGALTDGELAAAKARLVSR